MNLEELKQKAEAATPGPGADVETVAQRTFVAAANPQTVLALVKVVEALQEFRDADRDPTRIDELVGRLADTFDALEELEAME